MTALSDLVGMDDQLDPAEMKYRAAPARVWVSKHEALESERACSGCVFKGQKAKVCVQASQLARLAGFADCEDRCPDTDKTWIYVEVPTDPRQVVIK